MKTLLPLAAVITLLATSGCVIFPGHGDRGEHRDDSGFGHPDEHAAGVDHGEHPGDLDHGDTMQR